jgi:hypothetical protein
MVTMRKVLRRLQNGRTPLATLRKPPLFEKRGGARAAENSFLLKPGVSNPVGPDSKKSFCRTGGPVPFLQLN